MRADSPSGYGGTIVNIVSTLGYLPYQGFPVYAATKHAAMGFLKSIAEAEICKATSLKFITICPGYTDTGFVAGNREDARHPFSVRTQVENVKPQNPQVVADCLLRAIHEPFECHVVWRCVDGEIKQIELLDCKLL